MSTPRYQPFYCEENIWQLCQDATLPVGAHLVAVITGSGRQQRQRRCALWHQRLAPHPGGALLWDYHVVLLADAGPWQVWDLDSDLGAPVAAAAYLAATFPGQEHLAPMLRPQFRLIQAAAYVAALRSDRSHMRTESGAYRQPPPSWPPPGGGGTHNLDRLLDPTDPFIGEVVDLPSLRIRLACR